MPKYEIKANKCRFILLPDEQLALCALLGSAACSKRSSTVEISMTSKAGKQDFSLIE